MHNKIKEDLNVGANFGMTELLILSIKLRATF